MSGAPHDPRAVANLLLDRADRLGDMPITPLALQKLLYFVHAIFLRRSSGHSAMRGSFEAWQYGPVHPAVYDAFQSCGRAPIKIRASGKDLMTGQPRPLAQPDDACLRSIIDQVLINSGRLTPGMLVELSHKPGGAWDVIWKKYQAGDAISRIIPDSVTLEKGYAIMLVPNEYGARGEADVEEVPPEYRRADIRSNAAR